MNAYIGKHSIANNEEKRKYKDRLIHRLQEVESSGSMNFEEFGTIFEDMLIKIEMIESAKVKFAALDIDSSGALETTEIDMLLQDSMKNFSRKNQTQRQKFRNSFMRKVDENHNGTLTCAI